MEIDAIAFEATVLLGKVNIPFNVYNELKIGDICVLDQPVEKGLVVCVGQSECFLATAGLFEIHKAVIIDEQIYTRRN